MSPSEHLASPIASLAAADDHGNAATAATVVALGTAVTGLIESSADLDYFRTSVVAGTTYLLRLGGDLLAAGGLDWHLQGGGISMSVYYTYARSPLYAFTPTVSGDMVLRLKGGVAGAYSVQYTIAADDFGATAATAGALALGATVTGVAENPADRDWFAVQLEAGKTYFYDGKLSQSSMDYTEYRLALLDSAGSELTAALAGSGAFTTTSFTAQASGTYYLQVANRHSSSGVAEARADYTLSLRPGVPDDYPTSPLLKLGETLAGAFEIPTDVDYLHVPLEAGVFYRVVVSYFTPDGKQVQSAYGVPRLADLRGFSTAGAFEAATVSGQYEYLSKYTSSYGLYMSRPLSSTIDHYSVRLERIGSDDLPWYEGPARMLIGSRVSAALQSGSDTDTFAVYVNAGQRLSFNLSGEQSAYGKLAVTAESLPFLDRVMSYTMLYDPLSGYHAVATLAASTNTIYNVTVGNGKPGGYAVTALDVAADTTAPELLPGSALAAVSASGPFTLQFSEPVLMRSGGSITLYDKSGNYVDSFYVASQTTGGGGAAWTFDPRSVLTPGLQYKLSIGPGAFYDWSANVLAARDLTITVAAPPPTGTAGNDIFRGDLDGAVIEGYGGLDIAMIDRYIHTVGVTIGSDGKATLKDLYSSGTNTLEGIERIYFQNKMALALDLDGTAGGAYRLYRAAFDRAPDRAGAGYWIDAMDKGMSLRDVAAGFVASSEFVSVYGANATNAAFVERLYQNVLDRAGEQSGLDYWVKALDAGYGRADVLANFSQSAENTAAVALLIGNGFAYIPYL